MTGASESSVASRTFKWDLLRGGAIGVIESGCMAFTLLVAIRHFDAGSTLKAAISAAPSMGLVLTPIGLFFFSRMRVRPSRANALLYAIAGSQLVLMVMAPSLIWLSVCYFTCLLVIMQYAPLDMQLYSTNYSPDERGKRVAVPSMVSALTGACFGFYGGQLLDQDILLYPMLFGAMACAAVAACVASLGMPSQPLGHEHSGNPWQNVSLIWKDRLFGYLLMSWMFLGLGNLMTIPIRIEYLANDDYGLNATNLQVAVLTIAIPLGVRLLTTRMWGALFDKMDLIPVRNTISLVFLLSIVCFFATRNLMVIALGSVLFGVALGGGRLVWSLWVTKIAEENKRSSYQSVHGALTGVRGIVAPFLGYALVIQIGPLGVCWVGAGLIAFSMVLFMFVRKHPRLR